MFWRSSTYLWRNGAVAVPVSISDRIEQQNGCDNSSPVTFALLLNTCGVPTAVTQGLVQGFLGAATLITGAGELEIVLEGANNSIIFDANAGQTEWFIK